MKTKIMILLIAILTFSCNEWDNEFEFRNYLRDKHPYSEIIPIEFSSGWNYQVNDTLNQKVWIYTSWRSQNSVERHLIVCPKLQNQ